MSLITFRRNIWYRNNIKIITTRRQAMECVISFLKEYQILENTIGTIFSIIASMSVLYLKHIWFDKGKERRDEFNKIRYKIASELDYYSNFYTNDININDLDDHYKSVVYEGERSIRRLATDLSSFLSIYSNEKTCKVTRENIEEASGLLIGLSNTFYTTNSKKIIDDVCLSNYDKEEKIKKLLKI